MSMQAASLSANNATLAEPMMDMNMTPLIDVMLVLIIMLIITIPKQHHATTLGMPSISPPPITAPLVVLVEIDFDGTVLWDGLVVQGRAALEAKLRQAARAAVPPQLQLKPNKLAPYKAVAGIMATAQRAGVMNIGIVGNEQFL